MRALLDVNVLIALLDRQHEHHQATLRWLEENVQHGWATCAVTENGVLRIMSQPNYAHPWQIDVIAQALVEMTETERHEFWPDASLLTPGVIDWGRVAGPKQITDLHLLALAAQNSGRLVTFDERMAKDAVLIASDKTYHVISTP